MRARLKEKVEEADLALALKMQDDKTPQWAAANVEFADALYALAAEEDDRTAFSHYRQAVNAYEEALKIYTDAAHPDEWSRTIISLSKTLRTYAMRESGDRGRMQLERARQLVENVLQTIRRTRATADQAVLYIEMAHIQQAYADIGRHGGRRIHLEKAIAAFAEAARIFRGKEQFDNWVVTLVGQAMAWREIAALAGEEQEEQLAALYKSVDLFKSALNYYNRDLQPFDWVYIHFEYGRTFLRIAQNVHDERRHNAASAAVDALRIATESISMHDALDLWLKLRTELAFALSCLAQCPQTENNLALFEEAVQIYRAAANYYEEKAKPVDFAATQGNLGKNLIALGALHGGKKGQAYRLKGIEALRKGITSQLKNERQKDWIANFIELGTAFHLVANYEPSEKRFSLFEEAVEIYRKALSLITQDKEPEIWARLQSWLGLALAYLGEHDETETGRRHLKESELAFRLTLTHHEEKGNSLETARLESNIGNLFYTLARRSADEEAAVHLRDARQAVLLSVKNFDAKLFPAEWRTAQWNYGLILKHGLLRNLSSHIEEDYNEAAAAFRHAMSGKSLSTDPVGALNIKRALATLMLMRGKMSGQAADCPYRQKALALFSEIHDWAWQNGETSLEAQSQADMDAIRADANKRNRGSFFKKLSRFFQKINGKSSGIRHIARQSAVIGKTGHTSHHQHAATGRCF